jgi:hypothetical protein
MLDTKWKESRNSEEGGVPSASSADVEWAGAADAWAGDLLEAWGLE